MTQHSIDKIIEKWLASFQKGSFGTKQKVFFFKELSYLLKGWVSIIAAIQTMSKSTDNMAIKELCDYIYRMLDEGKSLTYALSRLPKYFSEWDVAIIKSWEKSGKLVSVLWSLAMEYTFLTKIKNQYVSAMIYPVILIVVSVIAVLALFLYILPGIFELVKEFDASNIPATTRFLMAFSSFLQNNVNELVIGALILVTLFGALMSTEGGKRSLYNIVFELPLVSKMTKYYFLIKFARYMRLMLDAGLSYVDLFRLQKDILRLPQYQDLIQDVSEGLQRGESIFDKMQYHTEIIPQDVLVLLKVWEETATLKESLQNIIEMYEEELQNTINNVSKLIEPLLIVFVWGIIAMIALSVFGIIGNVLDSLPSL